MLSNGSSLSMEVSLYSILRRNLLFYFIINRFIPTQLKLTYCVYEVNKITSNGIHILVEKRI